MKTQQNTEHKDALKKVMACKIDPVYFSGRNINPLLRGTGQKYFGHTWVFDVNVLKFKSVEFLYNLYKLRIK